MKMPMVSSDECRRSRKVVCLKLPNTNYGSAAAVELSMLESGLLAIQKKLKAKIFIVNISEVDRLGAAFLGALVRVNGNLKSVGCKLVVCGDRFELLRTTFLNRVIPTFDDVSAAKEFLRDGHPTADEFRQSANVSGTKC